VAPQARIRGTAQGFDYTFLCSVPFVANENPAESYEGRWKTEGFRLELLMGRAGSDHEDTCTLDIALKPKPFDPATPL
jgi:hypothetical protein